MDPSVPGSQDELQRFLDRPAAERVREYKYRFAQSVVFGLPVLGLQWFGPALGGAEAGRWIGIFQALLAGWVMYVGAAGMLAEGLLLIRRGVRGDLLVAAAACGLYGVSLISVLGLLVLGRIWYEPLLFHFSVTLVALWTGFQWWRWR